MLWPDPVPAVISILFAFALLAGDLAMSSGGR